MAFCHISKLRKGGNLTLRVAFFSVLLLLVGSAFSSVPAKVHQSDESVLKVGAVLSLSGKEIQFGKGTRRGIEMAIDEVNARGGIKGRKIKLLLQDSKGTTKGAKFSVDSERTGGGCDWFSGQF